MNRLITAADWVASLNPFAIACLVVIVGLALLALAALSWLFIYGARSGAGEGDPEEIDDRCAGSSCAWCHPGEARGICPAHAEQMKQEARR